MYLQFVTTVPSNMQSVSKGTLQLYSERYCMASFTKKKTFTLKGIYIIHYSTSRTMDSLYTFKCNRLVTL
jgi:hypothetical protein